MDGRWYHGFDLHFLVIAMAGTLSHTCWPFLCLSLDVCSIPLPIFNLVIWFCCCYCCHWHFSLWFFRVKIWCAPTESWGFIVRGGHCVFACPSPPQSVCSEAGPVSLISMLLQLALCPSEGRSLWKGGRRGNRQVGLPSGLPCLLPSLPSAPWTIHSLMSRDAGGMVWLPE